MGFFSSSFSSSVPQALWRPQVLRDNLRALQVQEKAQLTSLGMEALISQPGTGQRGQVPWQHLNGRMRLFPPLVWIQAVEDCEVVVEELARREALLLQVPWEAQFLPYRSRR